MPTAVSDLNDITSPGSGEDIRGGSEGSRGGRRRGGGERGGSGSVSGSDDGTATGADSGGSDGGEFGGGSDGRGDSGDTGGTGKRKRRRKEPAELVGEVANPSVAKRGRSSKKSGPDFGALIDASVVGLFGLAAVVTGHGHWLKDAEEVRPITDPLRAWVDQLPVKTLKKLEQNLTPVLFGVGVVSVVGPDIVQEMRERAKDKHASLTVSRPGAPFGGFRNPPANVPTAAASGANGQGGSAGGWAASVPADASIGYDSDV